MVDVQGMWEDLTGWWVRVRFRFNRIQRHRVYWMLANYLDMNRGERDALELVWVNVSEDGEKPGRPAAVAVQEWLSHIQGGTAFWEAMGLWVPQLEQMVVRAGSKVGSLSAALHTVRRIEAIGSKMRAAIFQAVAYPTGVALVLAYTVWQFGVTTVVQARKVSPKLVASGEMARLAVVSDFLQMWGLPIIVAVGLMVGVIIYTLPRWRGPMRARFDRYNPWRWYREWAGTAFVLSLVALLKAGMSQRDTLEELEAGANPWMEERVSAIRHRVIEGVPLGRAMRESFAFPDVALCRDIEALEGRPDLGAAIEEVAMNWVNMRVAEIERRAKVTLWLGMAVAGLVLVVVYSAMLSVGGRPGDLMRMM